MNKREKEIKIVSLMIDIYCKGHHHTKELCDECKELKDYATMRTMKCPFMETKTFCSNCKVHCYRGDMKEKIKEVMRYSGPRMLLYHPILAIKHVILSRKEKSS
jgi:hypothetical protein